MDRGGGLGYPLSGWPTGHPVEVHFARKSIVIKHFVTILLVTILLIGAAPSFADVRLPKILNSYMVLQAR